MKWAFEVDCYNNYFRPAASTAKIEICIFDTENGHFSPPRGVKKRVLQNPVVFLLIDPKTTHKPKMGMIHEEL